MAQCTTAVPPLLTQWNYCSLALSHWLYHKSKETIDISLSIQSNLIKDQWLASFIMCVVTYIKATYEVFLHCTKIYCGIQKSGHMDHKIVGPSWAKFKTNFYPDLPYFFILHKQIDTADQLELLKARICKYNPLYSVKCYCLYMLWTPLHGTISSNVFMLKRFSLFFLNHSLY